MWGEGFFPLSILHMRDNHVAEIAWRNGKLYFATRPEGELDLVYDGSAIEVADVEDAPKQDTRLLESATADSLYILAGHRTFISRTRGQTWEEY
jgi:hypothetical protein